MKKGFLRAVGMMSIVLMAAVASANASETAVREPVWKETGRRWQDKKSKRTNKTNNKPQVDKKGDIKKDVKKPDGKKKPEIKEVPRSIPKQKPKSVSEKIKIKRPPVKVKPKGLFRVF